MDELSEMTTRAVDLKRIDAALSECVVSSTNSNAVLARGDSLEVLRMLPAGSVSLILTDPPYHSTKKENIYGDKAFAEDEHFIEWMEQYAVEWKRVLRTNGAIYVFCSAQMSARLEVMLSRYFLPVNHITWTKPNEPGFDGWRGKMNKEALRRWYPHSERILFLEQVSPTSGRGSLLGDYLRERRLEAGISAHSLTELIGAYGKVNHGGAVSNWELGRNIPSREQYRRIVEVLEATGKVAPMPAYENIVRPFDMHGGAEFTDVWNFVGVRPFAGKHPAEKPLDLLMHAIEATTYEGDIVLDCFAGSGSTAAAALRLGRRVVAVEIEERWIKRIVAEVSVIAEDHVPELTEKVAKKTPKRSARRQAADDTPALFQ